MPSAQIAVSVVTYCRPAEVAELLSVLVPQCVAMERSTTIIVVDNDPDGSAETAVRSAQRSIAAGGWPCDDDLDPLSRAMPGIGYVREDEPGIAAARNRALAEAAAVGAQLLVFIDDDERPEPGWLAALVASHAHYGAAAVTGPVVSTFLGDLHPWIRDGGFFDRRRFASGTLVSGAASNNLLLDLGQLRAMRLRFDASFGLTGGSDTLFARQLLQAGGAIVWCDEAVVTDVVPAERLTLGWSVRKLFRIGNTDSRVALVLAQGRKGRRTARARAVLRGGTRIALGVTSFALGAVSFRRDLRARGLRLVSRGAGLAAGAVGMVYSEYRRDPSGPSETGSTR